MGREHDVTSPVDDGRSALDPAAGLNPQFTLPDIAWILQRLETHTDNVEPPVVVIGGQALNYWCDLYRIDNPDLEELGPFTSKDLDFQAARDAIPRCSERVGGEYKLTEGGDKSSLMNGIIYVPLRDGQKLRIDVMQQAYGLGADDVVKLSAPVRYQDETFDFAFQVMHPLHCMMSRVKNVTGLPHKYANEHGLRQLKASITCLRIFIEKNAALEERRGLVLNESVFKFALHDPEADKLLRVHGIDVFKAASNAECFSEKYRTIRTRRCGKNSRRSVGSSLRSAWTTARSRPVNESFGWTRPAWRGLTAARAHRKAGRRTRLGLKRLDMQRLLKLIPDERRCVVTAHYLDGMTLAQVGEVLGLTRERVRQLEYEGLDFIRRHLRRTERLRRVA